MCASPVCVDSTWGKVSLTKRGLLDILQSKYLQRDTSTKRSLHAFFFMVQHLTLDLDKLYIIMEMLQPDAKKLTTFSRNFYFCVSITL